MAQKVVTIEEFIKGVNEEDFDSYNPEDYCQYCKMDDRNFCNNCPLVIGNNISRKILLESKIPLFEGARHYFSGICFHNNADCEEHAYKLDIDIFGTSGLSELEKTKYISMFEQDCEGIIFFYVGNEFDKSGKWINFDNLTWEEIQYILREIEK